jgi:CheY-like chemotaxis protein
LREVDTMEGAVCPAAATAVKSTGAPVAVRLLLRYFPGERDCIVARGKNFRQKRTGERRGGTATPRGHARKAPLDILLVEDSAANRAITAAFLRDGPYRIDAAENGAVALKKFTAGRYDLVLMDRQMPVMDGLAATRAMRKWETTNGRPPTPIVALTASDLAEDRQKCVAAGCTAYLAKPVSREALLQAIGRHAADAPPREAGGRRKRGTRAPAGPGIGDLVPAFLRNRRRDVSVILDAADRGDFAAIEKLGHGMRGIGGNYGFPTITDIGAALEKAGAGADADAARGWARELASYLDRVQESPSSR